MISKKFFRSPKLFPLLAELKAGYTFDTFSLNDGSMAALGEVMRIAEESGNVQYPLVIYGGKGLGKTHLLHGAIYELLENVPEKKIALINGEYVRYGGTTYLDETFLKDCFEAEILFIDDFDLAVESENRKIFMYFVDMYLRTNKPMVVAMSKYSETLERMDEKTKAFFLSGTAQEVKYPSKMYCRSILKEELRKRYPEVYVVSNEAIEFVINQAADNFVSLKGTLMKVMAQALLTGTKVVDVEFAEKAIFENNNIE